MERLKITAHLQRGQIIYNGELYLDAILYNEKIKRDNREDYYNFSRNGTEATKANQMQLPIKRHTDEALHSYDPLEKRNEHYAKDSGVWLCSCAMIEPIGEHQLRIRKRFENLDYENRGGIEKKNVYLASGKYKNYDIPRKVVLVDKIQRVLIGEKSGIEDLLSTVLFIGKEKNIGYGRVSHRTIEPTDQEGQRHFPSRHFAKHEIVEKKRCLPPYSSKQFIWECSMRYF